MKKLNIKLEKFLQHKAVTILWLIIILYIFIFCSVSYLKYISFSFHDIDLAVLNQTAWNTVQGKIIGYSPGETTIFNGGHVFLILLVIAPLYTLFTSPLTLLFLQTLALVSGAWAIYLLARDLIKPSTGLVLAFCYLIYPALNYVNLFEFHLIAFSTPLLLFMFLFYVRKKWWLFIFFMILSLFCREDVSIPVFGFGVFALIQVLRKPKGERRPELKWSLAPLLSGVFWFFFCVKFLQPYFSEPESASAATASGMLGFYSWLGNSPGEIIHTLLFQPGKVLQGVLIEPKLKYLKDLFIPLAFVSILSPSSLLMVLISLSEGLLSQRFTHFSIRYQYSSIITPFVFISAIYGLRNLFKWKIFAGKDKLVLIIVLLFSLISAKALGPLFNLPEGIRQWMVTEEDQIRQKLVEKISPHAPVIATFEFTPKLSMRPRLFFLYQVYSVSRYSNFRINVIESQKVCQYALLDFNDWLTFYDFYTPGGNRDIYEFLREGNWQLKNTINSLALFEKGDKAVLGVFERIDGAAKESLQPISGIPQFQFAGLSLDKKDVMGKPVISLSVDLRCRQKIADDLLLLARFSNRTDQSKGFQQCFFAPYRIYPTSRWKPGDIVRQKCNLLVPEDIPGGDYALILSLIRKRPNLPLSPEAKKLFYNYYDTAMAMKYLPGRWGISPERLLEQIVIARIPKAVIIEE